MRTYLSVDIDFWCEHNSGDIKRFMKKILMMGKPVNLVVEHDELIPYVNKSEATRLINVDYHSDIADLSAEEIKTKSHLNNGTWVNYVKKDLRKNFIWIYPYKKCYTSSATWGRGGGRCDSDKNPFGKNCMQTSGWESVRRRMNPLLAFEEEQSLVSIGIAISPDYSSFGDIKDSFDMIYAFGDEALKRSARKFEKRLKINEEL
jgi:hypothetical protein